MGIIRKQPVVVVSASSPNPSITSNTNTTASVAHQLSTSFTKRKPVKGASDGSSSTSNIVIKSTAYSPPPTNQQPISKLMGPPAINVAPKEMVYSQNDSILPLIDASGRGMGMGMGMSVGVPETPKTPKTFQQSQDELFSKLDALAAVKVKSNPLESQRQTRPGVKGSNQQLYNSNNRFQNGIASNGSGLLGSPSTSALKVANRRTLTSQPSSRNGSGHISSSSTVESKREPRRRINSAQFKTPLAADMEKLAQVVVANASPPKTQDKVRKRASTLSLTTTTFTAPGVQNPRIVTVSPGGGQGDQDYHQKYDAAFKEAKHWEKKCSSIQHQLHYERERWEEKYGALEKAFKDLENYKAEANVEKMNSLLDTVQQLQLTNEVFRKQLMDAGIEPDPLPAAEFHSQHLLVGENLDRTFLEEDELIKEKSLVTNQKISHLSSELNNVAIAISQTINYVQLRYLTQMLDAAEHVTSQKRTRAMSNSFLSDMLSRGVKKAGPLQPKNTCTMATQTPPIVLTTLQLQQQQQFQQQYMQLQLQPSNSSSIFSKSFTFSSSLFNLAGLNGNNDMQYKLKGEALGIDRSQIFRQPIPPVVVQELKGEPASPDSADILAANRGDQPIPKFQYASPTTSQLHIVVPDDPLERRTISNASGSQVGSTKYGIGDGSMSFEGPEGCLRRSYSELSLTQLQQQQGLVKTGGKYPYPYTHSSKSNSSQHSVVISTGELSRCTSQQQFLSPEMAMMYSNNNSMGNLVNGSSGAITTNNSLLTASNIIP
ncbi:hypothetical protein BGX27_005408 [Mortierella sp. AM989]|nr:hypothetical protein BGX27_005408 [Mortierella sp. AM989]